MQKIKVLQVVESFGYGGVESFLINYYKHIDRQIFQFDFYIICTDSSPRQRDIEELGGNMYFANDDYSTLRLVKLVKKWTKFIKKGKYDIVHSHCNLINAWVLLAAYRAGVPVRLSHSHNTKHFYGSFVQKAYSYLRRYIIKKESTLILACGNLAGETMYGKNSGFLVINNGIDASKFFLNDNLDGLKQELKITNERVYVNINRICAQKNQTFVIDIFKEIVEKESNSILIIAGPSDVDDTEKEMISKIHQYNLENKVRILGSRRDVPQLYEVSDCCLFPSRWEGLPISLLETQAIQIPTLVSDTVTNEVDLGMGALVFLSLNTTPKEWAECAINFRVDRKSDDDVLDVFKEKGYDIATEAAKLGELYYKLVKEYKH